MNDDVKYEMMKAMRMYGGSFVQGLAECFQRADPENPQRLLKAFPEYVEKYSDIGRKDEQRRQEWEKDHEL